jgi:dipeptidyl aminopeptidase/acylaminoacyl peptidase
VGLAAGDNRTLAGQLWLAAPDVRRLRPTFPGATLAGATFLSDGRLALVLAMPPGDERQLWLVNDQGDASRAGPASARGSISISADGARVAYLRSTEPSATGDLDEVWVADAVGGSVAQRFALSRTSASNERLTDLSWAPDGAHLLVVSREQVPGGGQRTHVRLLDTTTGAAHDVASLPSDLVPGSYVWSPDGGQLALLAQTDQFTALCLLRTDGTFHYLADLAGDGTAPLPFPAFSWSPDGTRVLYAAPPQEQPASSGWLVGSKPTTALFQADATHPLPRQLPDVAGGLAPVWRTDDNALFLARGQDGTLVLRQPVHDEARVGSPD